MFIVCNDDQANKKIFKKTHKFIISSLLDDQFDTRNKFVTFGKSFLPSYKLNSKYLNDEISFKEFKKEYKKAIRKNDELYSLLIVLVICYIKNKDYLIVSSDMELDIGFIKALIEILEEDFGVLCCTYDKWKSKYDKKFNKMQVNEKAVKKAIRKYKYILNSDETGKKKKKNKKKKKSDKKSRKKTIRNLQKAYEKQLENTEEKAVKIIKVFKL